jgi:hypothetical protein
MDGYDTHPENFQGYDALSTLDKPFGFGEYGPSGSLFFVVPKVEKDVDYNAIFQTIKARYPNTTFIQAWNGGFGYQSHRNIDRMMTDPWMITRESLEWRRVCSQP